MRRENEVDALANASGPGTKRFATSPYADVRKFATGTVPTVMADANGRRFDAGGAMASVFSGKKADSALFSRVVPTPIAEETELLNRPAKPGALKSWSSASGRVLSVEEVREILNRTK